MIEAPVLPVSFVFWKAPNSFGFKMQPLSSVSCSMLVEDSSRATQSRTLKIIISCKHCLIYISYFAIKLKFCYLTNESRTCREIIVSSQLFLASSLIAFTLIFSYIETRNSMIQIIISLCA